MVEEYILLQYAPAALQVLKHGKDIYLVALFPDAISKKGRLVIRKWTEDDLTEVANVEGRAIFE